MVPPHRHLDYEAIMLCSGAYRFRINGTEMELTPGEGILVNIGDQHEDWRGDGAKFIGFSFTLEAFPATNGIPALLAPGVSPQEQRFRIDLKEAEGLARKIYEEEQRQTAFSRLIQEAISLELFWRIIQGLPRESLSTGFLDNTADGSFRARLSRLFQDHIEEVLTLDDIAKQLGISRTSLTNKCNELFHMSPGKAFCRCKMERAGYLLVNTRLTVKEIAGRLGYASEFAFSRAFRREFNLSPAEWRRNYIY